MGGYSEFFKEQAHQSFLDKWAPKTDYPNRNDEQRWWIARAKCAEASVEKYEDWFRSLRNFLKDIKGYP